MLRFRGTEQLDELAGRLREAPRRLQQELRSGLAAAARPAVQDVRREIRGVSMAQRRTWSARSPRRAAGIGRGSSPLRSPIAAAVQVHAEVRGGGASVEVELREQQVPARARWLVPYVVGQKGRLRHPFMGSRSHWVQATGNLDRWWPVLRKHMPRFARARDEAVQRVEQHIGG